MLPPENKDDHDTDDHDHDHDGEDEMENVYNSVQEILQIVVVLLL